MGRTTKYRTPVSGRYAPPVNRDGCLVKIYPTGAGMGARHALGYLPLILGRDGESDICIGDQSASRRHARIEPSKDGYLIIDLNSTNGTFVNETRIFDQFLKDGDYLRIGNSIFRFLAGGNVEAAYHEEIYRLTIIDGLTGIHNRRYFVEYLERELARSARYQRPLALMLLDLDRFKAVNDQLGHLGGDHTLREVAGCVKKAIRKEDLVARYGGEEFAVAMPETQGPEAVHLAERLRLAVEAHPFRYETDSYQVSISLGVVGITGDKAFTPTELIGLADEKMYEAKRTGRNRTVS